MYVSEMITKLCKIMIVKLDPTLSQVPIEALVDRKNGIDNRCPITDIVYDGQTIVVCVDGTELEY